jgi:hypothetical protein
MSFCLVTDPHRERESYFTTGSLPPISLSWRQSAWDSQPVIFFQLNTCGHSPYITSSLTRGSICCLQLLLALTSEVILRSKSHRTPFYCLRIETLPSWRPRSPYLYPSGTGWPGYTPRHWVPFSSTPTICRATLEVFHPASAWDSLWL